MIPPVPVRLRLALAVPLMLAALCLGALANWIVPEMTEEPAWEPKS